MNPYPLLHKQAFPSFISIKNGSFLGFDIIHVVWIKDL